MQRKMLQFVFVGVLYAAGTLFAEMTIEIVQPTDGAIYEPCQDIPIRVNVSSTSETIQYVYYYANGSPKGRESGEPWETARWTNVPTGNYVLTAKVRDTDRNEVWAEPVHIKVGAISNGDKVINGNFSCNTSSGWTLDIYEEGNGTITLMDDGYFDDLYYMYYESEAASTDWYVQFWQTFPVDSGHVYDIYFLADSDDPRSVAVGFQEAVDPYRTHVWQTVDIDGADEYAIEGSMAQFSDADNRFKFNLGGSDIPFYLDDIRVIDRSATSVKSKEMSFDGRLNEYELYQAYPNPFNMSTTIRFSLSQRADVQLDVYNMRGQKVKSLLSGEHVPGVHMIRWNGTNDVGRFVPSGVYIYRLTSSTATVDLSRKLLLLK